MAKKLPRADGNLPAPGEEAAVSPAALPRAPDRLRGATGTENVALQVRLLDQAMSAAWSHKGATKNDAIVAIVGALEAIAPSDAVEGMLATQMIATHEAAIECLRRAMIPDQRFEGRDVNLKHAAKLLQIYARQMEALDKHRGKGQQKITVEHVTVEAGGQAIVGNVQAPVAKNGAAPAVQWALSDQSAAALNLTDVTDSTRHAKQRVRRREQ